MKNIGIITMHRVINYGSALQAYALQKVISDLGYKCEIIDYKYPNIYHKKMMRKSFNIKKIFGSICQLFYGFPRMKKNLKFQRFYKDYFHLSRIYETSVDINSNPPHYDIYITGSDQVWNPKYINDDTTFLLSFASVGKKISYSSSFSCREIPDSLKKIYLKYLREYNSISVRELCGTNVVKEILGKDVKTTLDPTLLLAKKEWESLSNKSSLKISSPYILAYILDYSFYPYPYVEKLIDHIQKKTGYTVVLLCVANSKFLFKNHTIRMHSIGPVEFVSLFMNCNFVITTSFHGTAFALNFGKPFYSLINDDTTDDNRVYNILEMCDCKHRCVRMNSPLPNNLFDVDYEIINKRLLQYKTESMEYLINALK